MQDKKNSGYYYHNRDKSKIFGFFSLSLYLIKQQKHRQVGQKNSAVRIMVNGGSKTALTTVEFVLRFVRSVFSCLSQPFFCFLNLQKS